MTMDQEHWDGRRQAINAKRMKGPLIVADGGSYYRNGKKRFYVSKTAATGSLGSTYYGEKVPWEFEYWMECYE
jgi:hypothetical protein